MRVVTSYNNFARAKLDHDLQGRYDLPIYSTGSDAFENWISNFKGNAIYRAGWQAILAFQDCALAEFKFSNNQNYILVLYNAKMRFLSYDANGAFGWVLDGGSNILEITTPWTLAESKELAFRKSYAQNFDVMIFTHKDHEPQKLIRNSANSFTMRSYARKDDPFPLTWQATKTITAVTKATTAQITTSAVHGYAVGDRVKIAAIVGMTELNAWTATILTVPTTTTFTIDVDTTNFTAYSSAGTTAKVLTGDYPFVSVFGKGRLSYARSPLKTTTVWQSEDGNYYTHTLPATPTDASALQYTLADIAQPIDWMLYGTNSLIAGAADDIIAINGGGVGQAITAATVDANPSLADGTNSVAPVIKDGFIFYVGVNGRNMYYYNYDVLTETFLSRDANVTSYDVSLGGLTKIRYTKDRNNLVHALRGDGDLCTMNFNKTENIIGWHEHFTEGDFKDLAQISDNNGAPQIFALVLRAGVYYIERQAAYVEFAKRSDFYTIPDDETQTAKDAAKLLDNVAFNRYLAEQLKGCIFLDNSTTFSDLRSATITYNSGAGTITAGTASFTADDVGKHIVYKTATGYESGRFEITSYTSTTVVHVNVLQAPTANVYASWYLSFDTLTGLSRFDGLEISVVADGGYLGDFTVAAGDIDLPAQITQAVAGYKYRGLIKSFPLGFQVQGENTQTTMKAVTRVGVRAVASAGGKVGSTPYRMRPVQKLKQNNINYLPPLPIDGTEYVDYTDDNELDKFFYLVQDEPLPFVAASLMVDCNYTVTR
jgi:hypothetical protein